MISKFLFVALLCMTCLIAAPAQLSHTRGSRGCTPAVSIQAISGQAVNKSPVSIVEAVGATVDGVSAGCQLNPPDFFVGLLIKRTFDGAWFVAGLSGVDTPEGLHNANEGRWSVRDVMFPMPDLGKGFQVYAFLSPKSVGRFPNGVVDYESVRRFTLAISSPVEAFRADDSVTQVFPRRCTIELTQIRNVDGQMQSGAASQQRPIEVEGSSDVSGRFDRPDSKYEVYLVVTPTGSEMRWVMARKGSIAGNEWTETAYFGRKNVDAGESFRVQAFLSADHIEGGDYSMDEWRGLEQGICAMSKEVLVRRRIAPGDLVIRRIDEKDVTRSPMEVDFDFPLEGSVEETRPDTMLRAGETVWILARLAGSDEGWTVKSLAIVSTDGYTFKANVHFSRPGRYILMALASTVKIARDEILSEESWYKASNGRQFRRISRTVQVAVRSTDAPR